MKIGEKFFVLAAFVIVVVMGCSSTQRAENQRQGPRVHNIAPAFINFWNGIESKPIDEQLTKVKTEFFPNFPEFYNYKIEKWKKGGKNPDEELIKHLGEFSEIKNEFIKKTTALTRNLDASLASFVNSFPDLDRNFDVYVTHSFGEMDGGTRKIGEKIYFILGIEGMVKYHKGFASEVPFFHHELFHIYHAQFLPDVPGLWPALWAEGLATYASEKLNPGVSPKDMMLDFPAGMVTDTHKTIGFHWADLTSKLTSTADGDYESYFLFSSKNKKIVKRAGYYLGYLIAKEIGQTKSLSEMAKLDPNVLLPLIRKAIEKLKTDKSMSTENVNGFRFFVEQDKDDPDASDVYVDGTLDNRPYRFRLDTGAARSSIKSDDFTSTFKVVGTKKSAGVFAKSHDDLILVLQIQVGSLSQSQATVARTSKSNPNRANLLGMDFLKRYAFHFQYEHSRAEVVDADMMANKVSFLDLFMGENSHPYVDLSWEGDVQAKGVWDTGAGVTCFDVGFMKKHPSLFTKVGTSIGTDSSGTTQETPVYLLKEFKLGGKLFPAVRVVVIDLSVPNSTIKTPMDFILGYNVQKRANWIFDFPQKKWAISKMLD